MMDENNTKEIYNFGKEVVTKARDGTIASVESLLNGEANDRVGKKLFDELQKLDLSPHGLKIVKLLIVDYIDSTINTLFWEFEQSLGKYKIVTEDKNGNDFDIVTESDGLCYGLWEFIDAFSKYKSVYDIAEESSDSWELEKDRKE